MNTVCHYKLDSHCDWQVTDQFLCSLNYFANVHANLCSFHITDVITVAALWLSIKIKTRLLLFIATRLCFHCLDMYRIRKSLPFLLLCPATSQHTVSNLRFVLHEKKSQAPFTQAGRISVSFSYNS